MLDACQDDDGSVNTICEIMQRNMPETSCHQALSRGTQKQ